MGCCPLGFPSFWERAQPPPLPPRLLLPLRVPEIWGPGGPPAAGGRCGARGGGGTAGPKMAQAVNVAELSLPQLEVLKGQLDQVGPGGAALGGRKGPGGGCGGLGESGGHKG